MLMGKFLALAAALMLAGGCLAPVSGYHGGYGGYDGYYDNGYTGSYNPSYGYGYSNPAPYYGYSYGYPGCNTSTVYKSRTVVYPQSSVYQQPVYYSGTNATASNPPSSHWRRRQAQHQNYQRGPYHHGPQGNPANNPGQTSVGPGPGNAPGSGFANHTVNGPRHRFNGAQTSGNQTQAPFVRQGHRQHQAVNAPGLPAGPSQQGPRPQAMQASSPGSVMNRPMAQANPRPAMAAPGPTAGGNSGRPQRAPQGQGGQSRQKRSSPGSQ